MRLLRTASFNGVPFEVNAGSIVVGRRVVTHEFPQRDTPYSEDLGRAYRQFSLTGFVTGADYIEKARRLQNALEADSKGRLIHPWLGTLEVVVSDKTTISWDTASRLATFELSFIELGEQTDPSQSQSFISKLKGFADGVMTEARNTFVETMIKLNYEPIVDLIVNEGWGDISTKLKNSDLSRWFGLEDLITYTDTVAAPVLGDSPDHFAEVVQNLLSLSDNVTDERNFRKTVLSLCSLAESKPFQKQGLDNTFGKANNAIRQLCKSSLVADVVGLCSCIGLKNDTSADDNAATKNYDEVVEVQNAVLELLETEMINTERDGGKLYQLLEQSYAAVYQRLSSEVCNTQSLYLQSVKNVSPVLTLSYDHYEDSSRADEITARNGIVNPLFASGTLRMLNR